MRGMAYLLGLVAGLGLTVQVGMNAQLRKVLDSYWSAALVSFLVGTVALVALMVIRNRVQEAEGVLARIPRAREVLGPRVMAMVQMMLGQQKEARPLGCH